MEPLEKFSVGALEIKEKLPGLALVELLCGPHLIQYLKPLLYLCSRLKVWRQHPNLVESIDNVGRDRMHLQHEIMTSRHTPDPRSPLTLLCLSIRKSAMHPRTYVCVPVQACMGVDGKRANKYEFNQ